MAGVGGVLHNGRLILSVVELGGGSMLFEAEVALPASFSYVSSLVFAGHVVGTGARSVVDDAGFVAGLKFVFGFDQIFT